MARRKNTAEAFEVLFRMAAERAREQSAAAEANLTEASASTQTGPESMPNASPEAGISGAGVPGSVLGGWTGAEGPPPAGALARRPAGDLQPLPAAEDRPRAGAEPTWAGGRAPQRDPAVLRAQRWGPYREPLLRRPAPEGADRVRPGRYAWPPRQPGGARPGQVPRGAAPPAFGPDAAPLPVSPGNIESVPTPGVPFAPGAAPPDPHRQPPWRQVAEGSLLSRWLSSPEAGRPPQGYSPGPGGGTDSSAGPAVGGGRGVPPEDCPVDSFGAGRRAGADLQAGAEWGAGPGPMDDGPLDEDDVVAAGTPLGKGPVYSEEAALTGGAVDSTATQGGDLHWVSPDAGVVDGTGSAAQAPGPVEAALTEGASTPDGSPQGSGIRHWSSAGPETGGGGTDDGASGTGRPGGRGGASGRGASGRGAGAKGGGGDGRPTPSERTEVAGAEADSASAPATPQANLAETMRQPEQDAHDGSSRRPMDEIEGPPKAVAAGARRVAGLAWFSNYVLRWSGMRWLAGDRGTEALSKRVELRGGTLVVFFLSTVVVTFLLAAAWIIPRPQRSPYDSYQRGEFPVSSSESGVGMVKRTAPASVDVGTQRFPVEDEADALAVAHRERRARAGLPGKLEYWAPAERPFENSTGFAKTSGVANSFHAGGPTGDLPDLSAIKPRPKVSGGLRAREPPPEVTPAPPTAQYRVLVRSNADRRETEAFEAYFVKTLGLGCHLEAGPAVDGESLFRVFLDRKFENLRDANAFCREVKDVARATPFRSNYFLDALPLRGHW